MQPAIQEFDEAIRLNPQLAEAYVNRGGTYDNLGQPQRAIQDYDEAIRIDPEFAGAYANRAFAYTGLGKDTEAQQDVERAIALGIDPTFLKQEIEELKKQR